MNIGAIIEQFKKNDYSCFTDFYNVTKKQVYFTALSVLSDRGKAEDIMQETYITFLENVDNFNKNANVFSYLTVIARNKSINVYNRDKKTEYNDESLVNIVNDKDDIKNSDELRGVEEILSHLKDLSDREIITYHVIFDYKFREISEIMKIPLGTVLWRYNKAMKILRKEVVEDE